jgi:hypothetical protein
MKSTIYYSKRKFTVEPQAEAVKSKLAYDFTALVKATRSWFA